MHLIACSSFSHCDVNRTYSPKLTNVFYRSRDSNVAAAYAIKMQIRDTFWKEARNTPNAL